MRYIEKASFIIASSDYGEAAPIFRKRFNLRCRVREAFLQVTSRGVYEATINGTRIGDFLFAPGWTNYHHRLQYQQYNITSHFAPKDTESELQICVGKGWYGGRISYGAYTMPAPAVIAALYILYEDGTNELLLTDESWECAEGQVRFSDLYDGETYDARKIPEHWEQVCVCSGDSNDTSVLIEQEGEPIKAQETFSPIALFSTPKGEQVLDFGQNMTGLLSFHISGKCGDEVLLSFAEVLDSDGNFYTENYRSAKSQIRYICNGKKEEYRPRFSFQGFRYVRVDAWPGEITPQSFQAVAVYSDIKRTGYFRCSHPLLNSLYENIIWGQRSNFLDIPTDCPQRDERQGWTGDAQIFCRTASYNYDVERFFRKWLRDMKSEQCPDGSIPRIIPQVFQNKAPAPAAWGDACVIIPWQLYETYGNTSILEEQFDSMRQWVDYLRGLGTEECLWNTGEQYGDWLGLDAEDGSYQGRTDPYLIATAYFYHCTILLCKAGNVIGKTMTEYETLAIGIRMAFEREYIYGSHLTSDTQTAYALVLRFDLGGERKQDFADRLAKLVVENNNALSTGFVGTPCLLHALADNGYVGLAYDLLLREDAPSWLFTVKSGATTIWEHWDGIKPDGSMWSSDMNSFNHYAYGAVADFLYQKVCGINPNDTGVGFRKIRLQPLPSFALEWAEASIQTQWGIISSSWRKDGDELVFSFRVPEHCDAEVILPDRTFMMNGGSREFRCPVSAVKL